MHHRLHNDLIGVDKNVVFSEENETKEFDNTRPVNVDANKIKDFIKHNKKRIRSRSKNGEKAKSIVFSTSKKSVLKKINDTLHDEN